LESVLKGIVRGKLTGMLIDIKIYIFVSCLDAYNFFNIKGHHPLNLMKSMLAFMNQLAIAAKNY
jgi:hypothetical protein